MSHKLDLRVAEMTLSCLQVDSSLLGCFQSFAQVDHMIIKGVRVGRVVINVSLDCFSNVLPECLGSKPRVRVWGILQPKRHDGVRVGPKRCAKHCLPNVLFSHLDRVISREPIAGRVPVVTSQTLQECFDVWQGPTFSLGAIIEPIVGHTLAHAAIFLLDQDDGCAPRPIILDNLPCGQFFFNVLLDGLQLEGSKATTTRAIEGSSSRLQVDLMLHQVSMGQVRQVLAKPRDIPTEGPQSSGAGQVQG